LPKKVKRETKKPEGQQIAEAAKRADRKQAYKAKGVRIRLRILRSVSRSVLRCAKKNNKREVTIMAKKPRRSKDDKKSTGLSALQEYANKILVGEEAKGLFDEAGELPLNLQMAPNQGFRNPVPSGFDGWFVG
jgi:hypothetical protein